MSLLDCVKYFILKIGQFKTTKGAVSKAALGRLEIV
jgi:hypothetical protein